MPDVSPRMDVPLPTEFEEPYFQTNRDRDLAWDAALFANSENSQLQFMSTGVVGWVKDAAPHLYWTDDITVSAFFTPFRVVISGGVSVEIQDGEVLFFIMPRLMRANQVVPLYRANRISLENRRVHDLRLFVARVGDTLYFQNGASLLDQQEGRLFGGGLFPTTLIPFHQHEDVLIIEPPAPGIATLDALMTSPDLLRVDIFRNGQLLAEPDDYGMNYTTGIATLVVPTVSADERFVVWRETRDAVSVSPTHQHLPPLVVNPAPATAILDMLVTTPVLDAVALFRNGFLLSEPDDYSLNPATGQVTLIDPTVAGERFSAHRRVFV